MNTTKLISWNVNGLRACLGKGFAEFLAQETPDALCVQETKMQRDQAELDFPGYGQYWNSAVKKGYSGTAIFAKTQPLDVFYDLGATGHDDEGRVLTLEYPQYYLVTAYSPNAQDGLKRIGYRLEWEAAFRAFLADLDSKKPVILCGDLNVAHEEIDLKNPKPNRGSAGFSDEERDAFSRLLSIGFADTFRRLNPDLAGAYTWWSYRFKARLTNAGWRIDYFVVSERLMERVKEARIYSDVMGSDHCPVGLVVELDD